jgi:hypothetical protein
MKVEDLVKLNLSELESALEKGAFSKELLEEALKAEKEGKDRAGAIELYESALAEPESQENTKSCNYTLKEGASISFTAGIKQHGDIVNPEWPEFKRDESLFDAMIANGTLVEME